MKAEQLREQLVNQTYDQACRRSRKLVGRAIVARVERRLLYSFEGGWPGRSIRICVHIRELIAAQSEAKKEAE